MDEPTWTLGELTREVAARIGSLPAPRNGQVRAVPDERTIRYYGTLGLLDRPVAMRGRTALYGKTHLAQVIAIKRLQHTGRSLADIQELWPTVDHALLARISGVILPAEPGPPRPARPFFWKKQPETSVVRTEPESPSSEEVDEVAMAAMLARSEPAAAMPGTGVRLAIELAPDLSLTLSITDGVTLSPADVRAIRVAAAPLIAELAQRGLTPHPGGDA